MTKALPMPTDFMGITEQLCPHCRLPIDLWQFDKVLVVAGVIFFCIGLVLVLWRESCEHTATANKRLRRLVQELAKSIVDSGGHIGHDLARRIRAETAHREGKQK